MLGSSPPPTTATVAPPFPLSFFFFGQRPKTHAAVSLRLQHRRPLSARFHTPKQVDSNQWRRGLVSAAFGAAAAVLSLSSPCSPAMADLNRFEAEIRGEFSIGSAAQYGSADLRKAVHVHENLRLANFTSADMRESDSSGSTFNGAYLEKVVAYKANFTAHRLQLNCISLHSKASYGVQIHASVPKELLLS